MYKECPLVPENSTVLLLRSHIRDLTTWAPCFAMQITYTFGSEFKEKKKKGSLVGLEQDFLEKKFCPV